MTFGFGSAGAVEHDKQPRQYRWANSQAALPLHLSPAAERNSQSGKESFWCILNFWWYFQQQVLMQVHLLCLVHQRATASTEAPCSPVPTTGYAAADQLCLRRRRTVVVRTWLKYHIPNPQKTARPFYHYKPCLGPNYQRRENLCRPSAIPLSWLLCISSVCTEIPSRYAT